MLALSALLLSTFVFAHPRLDRRAACSCPSADNAFFPLGTASGPAGDSLQCVYPPLSRCEYSTTDGSLTKDSDFGQCPSSAPGGTCPGADTTGFTLGPGSGVHGSTLYCTYPADSESGETDYFCTYSSAGALTADGDDGFCPASAQCDGSTTAPTSINPSSAAAGHPSSHASAVYYTTVSFSSITPAATSGGLSEGPFPTGTGTINVGAASGTSGAGASASHSGAQSSSTSSSGSTSAGVRASQTPVAMLAIGALLSALWVVVV